MGSKNSTLCSWVLETVRRDQKNTEDILDQIVDVQLVKSFDRSVKMKISTNDWLVGVVDTSCAVATSFSRTKRTGQGRLLGWWQSRTQLPQKNLDREHSTITSQFLAGSNFDVIIRKVIRGTTYQTYITEIDLNPKKGLDSNLVRLIYNA